MNEKHKLTFCMAFLFFFVIVSFGIIVINEKKISLFLPKAEEKINNYIKEKYKEETDNFNISKTKYDIKCNCYKETVTNKDNKNLKFTISYKNKKITDTYKKDYKEGKTLLKTIENNITKELKLLDEDDTLKATIKKKLNKFNPSIKEKIINSKNHKKLDIYTVEKELVINNWTFEDINNEIINFNNILKTKDFNPISYTLYITSKEKPGESFIINNLKANYININILNELVPAIKDNNKDILKKYNM